MQDLPVHDLPTLVDNVEGIRLTNVAWIRQAESHNKASPSLPGARERTPVLDGTLFWMSRLAALSVAVGGDDARVLALLDRALAKIQSEAAAA